MKRGLQDLRCIIILAALFLIVGFFFWVNPVYADAKASQGGNVSNLRLSLEMHIWQGYYGNLSLDYNNTNITFFGSGTGVNQENLGLLQCYETEVYATTLDSINWSEVEAGNWSIVDDFIGLIPTTLLSAETIFNDSHEFKVYGSSIVLPSTRINSQSGDYNIGILQQGTIPIFVVDVISGEAFDGSLIDYQIMLPSPIGSNSTYFFYTDPADDCETPIIGPIDDIVADEGELIIINASAVDPNSDPITYYFDYPFESDDANVSTGSWQTDYLDSGSYTINVTACDNKSNCVSVLVNVLVIDVSYCGDGTCSGSESSRSCSEDCGRPPGGSVDIETIVDNTITTLDEIEYEEEVFFEEDLGEMRDELQDLLDAIDDAMKIPYDKRKDIMESIKARYQELTENIPRSIELANRKTVNLYDNIMTVDIGDIDTTLETGVVAKQRFTFSELSEYKAMRKPAQELFRHYAKIDLYLVTYLDASKQTVSIIVLNLTTKEAIDEFDIIIDIPKTVSESASEITISPAEYIVLEEDPLIKFPKLHLEENETIQLKLRINEEIPEEELSKIKILNVINETQPGIMERIIYEKCEGDCILFFPMKYLWYAFILLLISLAVLFVVSARRRRSRRRMRHRRH